MINPRYPAAVIAGNTEVSQAITDCLFGALGLLAASQGTMNNFVYGNASHQNYETICGGTGAGPDHPGTRRGAQPHDQHPHDRPGGAGTALPGAGGGVRHPHRLGRPRPLPGRGRGGPAARASSKPMTATLLSSRRLTPPYGLAGGGPGACGRNRLIRADGRVIELRGDDEVQVRAGDQIVIETPGGGGYGPPD